MAIELEKNSYYLSISGTLGQKLVEWRDEKVQPQKTEEGKLKEAGGFKKFTANAALVLGGAVLFVAGIIESLVRFVLSFIVRPFARVDAVKSFSFYLTRGSATTFALAHVLIHAIMGIVCGGEYGKPINMDSMDRKVPKAGASA